MLVITVSKICSRIKEELFPMCEREINSQQSYVRKYESRWFWFQTPITLFSTKLINSFIKVIKDLQHMPLTCSFVPLFMLFLQTEMFHFFCLSSFITLGLGTSTNLSSEILWWPTSSQYNQSLALKASVWHTVSSGKATDACYSIVTNSTNLLGID